MYYANEPMWAEGVSSLTLFVCRESMLNNVYLASLALNSLGKNLAHARSLIIMNSIKAVFTYVRLLNGYELEFKRDKGTFLFSEAAGLVKWDQIF